jgi:hypothetical protein
VSTSSVPPQPPPNHTELYGKVGIPVSVGILFAGLNGFATGRISLEAFLSLLGIGIVGIIWMVHLLRWHIFTILHGLLSALAALLVTLISLGYVIWTRPTAEDLETEKQRAANAQSQDQAEISKLQSAFEAATNERNNLQRSLEETTSLLNAARAQLGPKSPLLGLDSAKKWNVLVAMNLLTKNNPCSADLASLDSTTDGRKSIAVFKEILEILDNSRWTFDQASKSFFPPGITIIAGAPSGHERECALHLTDLLKSLNISPVTMTIDENDQDLTACKCVEVILGKLDKPWRTYGHHQDQQDTGPKTKNRL